MTSSLSWQAKSSVFSFGFMKTLDADILEGYLLFRRDRLGRKGGDIAIYIHRSYSAAVWTRLPSTDPLIKLLWVKVVREHDVTFVGALYHPPAPLYVSADLLDVIEYDVLTIVSEFPDAHVILAGDLNMQLETDIVHHQLYSSRLEETID